MEDDFGFYLIFSVHFVFVEVNTKTTYVNDIGLGLGL